MVGTGDVLGAAVPRQLQPPQSHPCCASKAAQVSPPISNRMSQVAPRQVAGHSPGHAQPEQSHPSASLWAQLYP